MPLKQSAIIRILCKVPFVLRERVRQRKRWKPYAKFNNDTCTRSPTTAEKFHAYLTDFFNNDRREKKNRRNKRGAVDIIVDIIIRHYVKYVRSCVLARFFFDFSAGVAVYLNRTGGTKKSQRLLITPCQWRENIITY